MISRRFLRPLAITFALLSATCFAMQRWGRYVHVEFIRLDPQRPKVIELHDGNLWFSWQPRPPYRPRWAGQVNRLGFRLNVYSDGSWNARVRLWVPGAMFAAAALLTGNASRLRRVAPGHCPRCGYDLRASPERCPECGAVAPANPQAGAPTDRQNSN